MSDALVPTQMIPSLPARPEVSATDTDGVGSAKTVTVVEAVEVIPKESVAVTVYEVVAVGEMVVEEVLEPVLQT